MHILSLRAIPKSEMEGFMVLESYSLVACRQNNKKGLFHTVALPFTIKSILMQKEELWKLKYFTKQKYNLQRIL
jgi:hypothetical protein